MGQRNVERVREMFEAFDRKGAALPVRDRVAGVFADFDAQGRYGKAWFFLSWDEALSKAEATE